MNPKSVVVGIDGSECAQRALEAAVDLAGQDGTVHIVTAYHAPSAAEIHETYASIPKEFRSTIDLLVGPRNSMHAAARFVEKKGISTVEHFVDDDPASAILDTAKATDAQLIVVGSRGLGRAARMVRGSVSTKVANHSRVDFMVVH